MATSPFTGSVDDSSYRSIASSFSWTDIPRGIRAKNGGGQLPLHCALWSGRAPLQLIQYLIELYPEAVNSTDNDGNLPLHIACLMAASRNVIQLALDRFTGDDRNHRGLSVVNNDGQVPLHCYVICDGADTDALQPLLDLYPEGIHATDRNGRLPLHVACTNFSSSLTLFAYLSRQIYIIFFEKVDMTRHRTNWLGVCNTGRNVILLLKVHGVQDEMFLEMQRQMLNALDEMLIDPQKAMEMIPRLSGPDSSLSSALVHMLSCGLSPTNEPFLFSCLHAIRAHHLMNLRKKSRVFVDKGAVLIGGLDETGLVPEGCVFVQINKDGSSPGKNATQSKSLFEVLDGPVMVTKHPVVHPGDVRMLLAVDIPELRTHKNVILFSQHGSRPEADKMAGSDLDGDQFAVTWDERLFLGQWNGSVRRSSGRWTSAFDETLFLQASTRTQDSLTLQSANKEPMDFDPDSSESILSGNQDPAASMVADMIEALIGMSRSNTNIATHDNAVNDEELLGHFINHAKNDNLGHIATMWLDYANKNGADCEECLKLAALHSIAVDFPKSGKPAVIPRNLYISRTTARAHWREKKGSPSYDCEGALGRMYDEVVNKMRSDENRSFSVPLAGRRFDRHGQILRFIERDVSVNSLLSEIYTPQMPIQLGLNLEAALEDPQSRELELLSEAMDHRDEYEQGLIGLMSKYGLQCEGELLTGCIRKYHKLDKKRQHDLSEAVRGQCRELRKNSRQTFFLYVLYTVCPGLYQEDSVDEDEETTWVQCIEALVTNKILPPECPFSGMQMQEFKTLAFQLAAAYYEATYNTEMWWNEPSSHKRRSVLFSFPWIVADVMAFGLAP